MVVEHLGALGIMGKTACLKEVDNESIIKTKTCPSRWRIRDSVAMPRKFRFNLFNFKNFPTRTNRWNFRIYRTDL